MRLPRLFHSAVGPFQECPTNKHMRHETGQSIGRAKSRVAKTTSDTHGIRRFGRYTRLLKYFTFSRKKIERL